jgi:hypothetical protein
VPSFASIAVFLFGPLILEWWTLARECLYLECEILIPTKYSDLDRIGEMTTRKQIEANRRNSRMSTGPKTQIGKAESKMNAMKHGLLAADLVVRDEDPVEFAGVLEKLVNELQPQGPLEEQLVERVAACMWRLRRLYRVETGIFTYERLTIALNHASEEVAKYEVSDRDWALKGGNLPNVSDEKRHDRAMTRLDKAHRLVQEEAGTLGAAFRSDAIHTGAISKLSRYEAAIERSLYRALHELQRVQAARQEGKSPPSIAVDVTLDGPGPAPDSDD